MKILYLSALSSEALINDIYKQTIVDPGFALQKFSRLVVRGFLANGLECRTLTSPPVTRKYTSKFWFTRKREVESGIDYSYIPFVNIPILRHLFLSIFSFFYVLIWGIGNKEKKVIVCDGLNVSTCIGALIATKINRIQSVAIVTHLYGLMVSEKRTYFNAIISKFANFLHNRYVSSFDKYVLLTECMSDVVNPRRKPYLVMEAICDTNVDNQITTSIIAKEYPRTIIYAGGLYEEYGVGKLVESFLKAELPNVVLKLYGSGPYVQKLEKICEMYSHIKYMGVKPNSIVIEDEMRASLLVNPRPTCEEFTKYSFPSKNIEYMSTGTYVLTTRLPGMPVEYYPYVFLIEDESVEGYANALKRVFQKSEKELNELGKQAKKFVLDNKNNTLQAGRIIDLIKS